ncbi:hypothetical protein ZHAS_00007853 [Anopheles sinensis]|uniref:Uncharacterized protein n=1 Tax=Anopheles sinensis TaxID=74873 RepID=A0A084VQY6_ANOSI|nr:hypothetical protein ZHAS_00007853 [Anopheles sinensis]
MIIITGSTPNGDGELPALAGEDDERHLATEYGELNGTVVMMEAEEEEEEQGEQGTSLELSPVEHGVGGDEVENDTGSTDEERNQGQSNGECQLDVVEQLASDDEDLLLLDGRFCEVVNQK